MSEQQQWCHGAREAEFWTIHRGWRVFIRKSPMGWHWSIARDRNGVGSIESDRPTAEAAAFAAIDRREVPL